MIEYLSILIFLTFAIILSAVIPAASYVLGIKNYDKEKLAVFECGFANIGDTRQQFEVKFFLVAILFIIFDLEISFLFP
jgi:NADH:ubiquinone oxidoreductase subunit 3 (subunit A)